MLFITSGHLPKLWWKKEIIIKTFQSHTGKMGIVIIIFFSPELHSTTKSCSSSFYKFEVMPTLLSAERSSVVWVVPTGDGSTLRRVRFGQGEPRKFHVEETGSF